jgi:hypothetical protein
VNDALAGETQPAADERFVGTDQATAQPAAQRTVEPVQQLPAAALEGRAAQLARGRIGVLVEFLKLVENLGDIFDLTLSGVGISSEPAGRLQRLRILQQFVKPVGDFGVFDRSEDVAQAGGKLDLGGYAG